ncbi:hypothetical protein [Sporichthya sp.]|uniref:hypothetical protein n=1 Tax=Sporichthya sp. TaxID=65475 RepID=UPI0017F185AC|nr:hypothetical protein [Sporichthya sp.]MBA3742491.1 hypothetical protein [Sporichthya sp.]
MATKVPHPTRDAHLLTLLGQLGATTRYKGTDHPDVAEIRQQLKAAKAQEYLRSLIADAPPLTPRQIQDLRALLAPRNVGSIGGSDVA